MNKWIGKFLVTILGAALLVYSAMRSLDFIQATLTPDRQILAWFGLAALDGGLVAWMLAFLNGSHGGAQRGISLMMVVVDFLGAVIMFTADTLLNTGEAGLTQALNANAIQTIVLVLSGVIALNVAAVVAHHVLDPEKRRQMMEEEALDKIEEEALRMVARSSSELATEIAPRVAQDWVAQTRASYANKLTRRQRQAALPAQSGQAQSGTPAVNVMAMDVPATPEVEVNPTRRQRKSTLP